MPATSSCCWNPHIACRLQTGMRTKMYNMMHVDLTCVDLWECAARTRAGLVLGQHPGRSCGYDMCLLSAAHWRHSQVCTRKVPHNVPPIVCTQGGLLCVVPALHWPRPPNVQNLVCSAQRRRETPRKGCPHKDYACKWGEARHWRPETASASTRRSRVQGRPGGSGGTAELQERGPAVPAGCAVRPGVRPHPCCTGLPSNLLLPVVLHEAVAGLCFVLLPVIVLSAIGMGAPMPRLSSTSCS